MCVGKTQPMTIATQQEEKEKQEKEEDKEEEDKGEEEDAEEDAEENEDEAYEENKEKEKTKKKRRKHKCCTEEDKQLKVGEVDNLVLSTNMTETAALEVVGIHQSSYSRWSRSWFSCQEQLPIVKDKLVICKMKEYDIFFTKYTVRSF